ncbi:MAG: serine/threonine-protein kinase [Myxococcota bacterium]
MGTSEVEILPPGTVIGETYEIVREVATGGMGTVYEARNVRLSKRRLAVKVLSKLTSKSAELLPRFRREAEIGASLNHPNIITVTDWNTLPNGLPFFVMEYLEGESLATRLRREKLGREMGYHVLESVGGALIAAHQQGVIHRDLKPSNVFLARVEGSAKPFVKVLDFGISKLIFDETLETTSKLLGTPRYMSPEQVRNRPVDERSDGFALATIAYEIFGGRLAFPGDSLEAILFHVVHDDPTPLAELCPDLEPSVIAAVEKGMAKSPDERFDSIKDFLVALRPDGAPAQEREANTVLGGSESTSERPEPLMNSPRVIEAKRGNTMPEHDESSKIELSKRGGMVWIAVAFIVMLAGTFFVSRSLNQPIIEPEPAPKPKPEDPIKTTVTDDPPPDEPPSEPAQPVTPATPTLDPATPNRPAAELPGVAARLNLAEKEYAAGKYRVAIRLAQQSLKDQRTPRAHRIITQGYCGLKDLGGANAAFLSVNRRDRRRVVSECRKYGIEPQI